MKKIKPIQWIEQHHGLAAWIQAAGAIIALALTLSLPYQTTHEAEQQARQTLKVYALTISHRMEEGMHTSTNRITNENDLRSPSIKAQDIWIIGQAITIDRLPEELIPTYFKLRDISTDFMATRMSLEVDIAASRSDPSKEIDWEGYNKIFADLKNKVDAQLAVISK